ncbi:peptidylprolyl isomerase [Novosphingobium sp. 9U]|uniref:peptidylprolyl isomerase n=1 Tax=Novosphingobium sp. 9U TaxID=2653158 RepID=UPI001F15AF2B|nr:peptidylprolyl isomerase [Novosphingobium sp. 9U]
MSWKFGLAVLALVGGVSWADFAMGAEGAADGAPAAASASSSKGAAPAAAPLTPAQIVAAAPHGQWVAIAPEDLLVVELAPRETVRSELVAVAAQAASGDPTTPTATRATPAAAAPIAPGSSPAAGLTAIADAATTPAAAPRRVVIQLIGPPYSQGWVANMRVLAAEHWWDGLAIVRAQDNYVVQWGDPESVNPALARPLPGMLQKMPQADYVAGKPGDCGRFAAICPPASLAYFTSEDIRDAYADSAGFVAGWPVAVKGARSWPVHCYGSVGVGRDMAPDTGTGAELYAVIGQAPRQLDRNIAVVGRVIEGIEWLSSLPRGTAELGFYATPAERTGILSIRPGNEVPDLPRYEYLSTSGASFAQYVHARANRQDDFYIQPAGSVDVCNVPVPVRKAKPPVVPTSRKKQAK